MVGAPAIKQDEQFEVGPQRLTFHLVDNEVAVFQIDAFGRAEVIATVQGGEHLLSVLPRWCA